MPLSLRNGVENRTDSRQNAGACFSRMSGSEPAPQPFLDLAPPHSGPNS